MGVVLLQNPVPSLQTPIWKLGIFYESAKVELMVGESLVLGSRNIPVMSSGHIFSIEVPRNSGDICIIIMEKWKLIKKWKLNNNGKICIMIMEIFEL